MIHLDDATIFELLDLPSVTASVRDAFVAWGQGHAATTQRVRASADGAMASAMAAVVPPYSGGKVYATANGAFTFVNVLFDVEGRLLCTLDGDALTRFRTPAACAIAIRELAAPHVTTAALIGAGRQGWYHLEMLAAELPELTEVRIHDVRAEAAAAMVERALAAGISARVADEAPDAVDGAQLVVTVTQSNEPLFPASTIGPATLICAVGATKRERCEIGPDVVERCAAVVCDDVVGSTSECGDLLRAVDAGRFSWDDAVELHALAARRVAVARAGDAPVLFETQGVALQDVAASALAWERHRARTQPGTDQGAEPTKETIRT